MRLSSSLFAAALCTSLAAAATAAAAITCDGNVQVQRNGERIITPYCQDGHLAEIAREYGAKTTAHEMRWDVGEKARICRFIGEDIRVRDTCEQYLNRGRNDIWQ